MKKICFVVPTLGIGGAERVAFHLLNNLNSEKYELFLIETKEKGEYLKDLSNNVIKECLNKNRFRYSLLKLYKKIKEINPDIIISFSTEISIFLGLIKPLFFRRIKLIIREINLQSNLNRKKLKLFLMKRAYCNSNVIISQSLDMTEELLNKTKIDKNKIVEINNPINIKMIEEKLKTSEKIFDNNYKNIICVGRLSYQKGFDLIINIMAELRNKKIRLYILGEGEKRLELEELIKKLHLEDSIFLLGRKDNPYIYMKQADLFILSSRFEGFPNVLLEANACGCYAICNNSPGGISEIIKENINGNVVNFLNISKTKRIIEESLLKEHNKEKIKLFVVQRFKIEKIIEKYEDVIKKI